MRATDGDKAGAVTEAGGKARSESGVVAAGTASSTVEKTEDAQDKDTGPKPTGSSESITPVYW